jgi:hypothetical protein
MIFRTPEMFLLTDTRAIRFFGARMIVAEYREI